MSDHDLPPLDEDVRALLEGARGVLPAPDGADARVLARVEAIVLLPPPGGGGGGGAAADATSIGASSFGALRRLVPLAAAFLVGGGAGAGAMRLSQRPPPAPVVVESPPRVVYVDRPAPAVPTDEAPSAAASAAPAAVHASSFASVGAESGLAAERALLDVARGAIERQNGAAALAAVHEHERRFPGGMLVQEREAMAVRALLLLGRRDEARARAERFRARFPGSVLTQALDSQVGTPVGAPASSP